MFEQVYTYQHPTKIVFCKYGLPDLSNITDLESPTILIISKTVREIYLDGFSGLPSSIKLLELSGSNPDVSHIDDISIENGTTQIIAMGGGSILDTGRALFAKLLTHFRVPLLELIQNPVLLDECSQQHRISKLCMVPTTFGTSSELTQWATMWDHKAMKKLSISHQSLYADYAVIAPELSHSLPYEITAYTGLDTLSHAMESLWNKNASFITRSNALRAIDLCVQTLPQLLKNLDSAEHRCKMAQAAVFAGLAFSNTKTAAAHSMSYPLTLLFGIPHGFACSLTLGKIFEYNMRLGSNHLEEVQHIFQRRYSVSGTSFSEYFRQFLIDCGVSYRLGDYGVAEHDVDILVENAFHPDRFNNMLYTLQKEEVREIYQSLI